jgi:hypothetical protein
MNNETTFGGAEHYRLLLLIDQLQREGKTEAEITSAVREVSKERDAPAVTA